MRSCSSSQSNNSGVKRKNYCGGGVNGMRETRGAQDPESLYALGRWGEKNITAGHSAGPLVRPMKQLPQATPDVPLSLSTPWIGGKWGQRARASLEGKVVLGRNPGGRKNHSRGAGGLSGLEALLASSPAYRGLALLPSVLPHFQSKGLKAHASHPQRAAQAQAWRAQAPLTRSQPVPPFSPQDGCPPHTERCRRQGLDG